MTRNNLTCRSVQVLFSVLAALVFILTLSLLRPRPASAAPGSGTADVNQTPVNDNYQRSAHLDTYTILADSGPARGENIYFYKCWMCHNPYTKDGGPSLKDLYQRDTLSSGDSVSDDTVTAKIKEGGAGMPAFSTSLSDADIKDLVAYFRSGKCCFDGTDAPANPLYKAQTNKWPVQSGLTGGATGTIKIASGDSPEGVGVQLIAPNGIRTTVYTNADGKFEFPKMQAGSYVLRIPTPVPFKSYERTVSISGATKLDDIVLERVANKDDLPASSELESQLSGAEILWNLPGSAEEKALLQKNCSGCHSWQQIFRNRYDERSWSLIVDRMMHHAGTAIAVRTRPRTGDPEADILIKFLSRVRGPDSKDMPLRVFPRPRGDNTRVVVTEYELPQQLLALHDAFEDDHGQIWFTSHKTLYVGKVDPKTGIVTEYKLPETPGVMPGSHHVVVDKNGIAWVSENWAHQLNRLDPKTGADKQWRLPTKTALNAPSFGNFAMAPDGSVWDSRGAQVRKFDPESGKVVAEFPLQAESSYDAMISYDGKYWGGSGPAQWGNTFELLNMQTGQWVWQLKTGDHFATGKRGGFDPYGDPWFGGADGALIELNAKAGRVDEFWPPTAPSPFTDFYEAMPDKNGEVWAGVLHGRQMVRLDPKTGSWHVYDMPEPYSYDRRTVIDNSNKTAAVWYVDYNGYLVRVQPLD